MKWLSDNMVCLEAGDEGYTQARLGYNTLYDPYPALIARCRSEEDVLLALRHAQQEGLAFTVRSGGNDMGGRSAQTGAMLIDLGPMNKIEIDPVRKVAKVQGGALLGDISHAAKHHGLMTVGGSAPGVGIGGFALAGGWGRLSRRLGAMVDNILALRLVTMDGRVVRTSADEYPELFWGMRGAGPNFGITTEFELQLHKLGPTILSGRVFHPLDAAQDMLRFWRSVMANAPDDLSVSATLLHIPDDPLLPDGLRGTPVAVLDLTWLGDIAQGEGVLRPIRSWGTPLFDTVQPIDYCTLLEDGAFQLAVGEGRGIRANEDGAYLAKLSDQTIETAVAAFSAAPCPSPGGLSVPIIGFGCMGGAFGRVDNDSMAFSRAGAQFWWAALSMWNLPEDDERMITWTQGTGDRLREYSAACAYINLTVRGDEEIVRQSYGQDKWERLVDLKTTWDPENLLRFNKNIPPRLIYTRSPHDAVFVNKHVLNNSK